jgi:hypothetical protein
VAQLIGAAREILDIVPPLDDFVSAYDESAAPFEWKKAVVFPSKPKPKHSDLCK